MKDLFFPTTFQSLVKSFIQVFFQYSWGVKAIRQPSRCNSFFVFPILSHWKFCTSCNQHISSLFVQPNIVSGSYFDIRLRSYSNFSTWQASASWRQWVQFSVRYLLPAGYLIPLELQSFCHFSVHTVAKYLHCFCVVLNKN